MPVLSTLCLYYPYLQSAVLAALLKQAFLAITIAQLKVCVRHALWQAAPVLVTPK